MGYASEDGRLRGYACSLRGATPNEHRRRFPPAIAPTISSSQHAPGDSDSAAQSVNYYELGSCYRRLPPGLPVRHANQVALSERRRTRVRFAHSLRRNFKCTRRGRSPVLVRTGASVAGIWSRPEFGEFSCSPPRLLWKTLDDIAPLSKTMRARRDNDQVLGMSGIVQIAKASEKLRRLQILYAYRRANGTGCVFVTARRRPPVNESRLLVPAALPRTKKAGGTQRAAS